LEISTLASACNPNCQFQKCPRSFYFYNTRAEVARFVEVVQEIQKFFGG
jgi:selenocysteine lyase/cysteine desulfurase